MRPSSLLPPLTLLAALIPPSIAATVQFCTGFEGPSPWFDNTIGFNVTVHDENSTVLMFRSNDFAWDLEGSVDFDVMKQVDDSTYPICSTSNYTDSRGLQYCNSTSRDVLFDQSTVLNKLTLWPVTSARLSPGESQNYTVQSAGAYCVLIHQENAETIELDGIDIQVSHSYGDFPLTVLLSVKLAVVALLVLVFHAFFIPCVFPNTPLEHRYGFWKLLKLSLQGKLVVWMTRRLFLQFVWQIEWGLDGPLSPVQLSPWFMLDHALSLAFISVLYAVWNGIFCKYRRGFNFFGYNEMVKRWEFVSVRTVSAYTTTIVISSIGQILVHHVVESVSLQILFMNIDASLVALIFSSKHRSKLGMKHIDADHCSECGREVQWGPPWPYEPAQNEPDFTDVQLQTSSSLEDDRDYRDNTVDQTLNLMFGLVGAYSALDTYILLHVSVNMLGICFPYFYEQFASNMTYHHVIGLNLIGNWIGNAVLLIWSYVRGLIFD